MKKAYWERTTNSTETEWYFDLPKLRPGHPRFRIFLKNLARRKMADSYLISAEFRNVREVFEPWISLIIDEGKSMRFYGIYISGLKIEDPQVRPSICFRKGAWDGNLDFENFSSAEDKLDYVTRYQALEMDLSFSSIDKVSRFYDLSRNGVEILQKGIKLTVEERPENKTQNISLDLWDEEVHYLISYSPLSKKNNELEKWIDQWTNWFESLNLKEDFFPDGPSRISYRESLPDWIRYFSEYGKTNDNGT